MKGTYAHKLLISDKYYFLKVIIVNIFYILEFHYKKSKITYHYGTIYNTNPWSTSSESAVKRKI